MSLLFARRVAVPTARFVRTKTSTATATWRGTLKEGQGAITVGSRVFKEVPYSHPSRFETDISKTNPEELIGAAHAGCYSMFLSALLTKEGMKPDLVHTVADVTLGDGPTVTSITLKNECTCSGLTQQKYDELAAAAKAACPIGKALSGVPEIKLETKLL